MSPLKSISAPPTRTHLEALQSQFTPPVSAAVAIQPEPTGTLPQGELPVESQRPQRVRTPSSRKRLSLGWIGSFSRGKVSEK
ncbi:hypothetical protein RSAG8_10085, partial [Rhizoctonia solani AG-8 WAC10335]